MNTLEETVIVDNTWSIVVPAGFKYSTDKEIIGEQRNIIFIEDKPDNHFEFSFNASMSFTSLFTPTVAGFSAQMLARMYDEIGGSDVKVLKDEEDLYVSYSFNKSVDGFVIRIGCGNGVSNIQAFFHDSKLSKKEQTYFVEKVAKSVRLS